MKHIITQLSCTALAIGQFTPAIAKPIEPSGDRRVSIAYVADIHAQIEPKPELFWADGKDPDQSFSITAGHRPGAPEHMMHRVPKCEMIRKVEQTTHDAVRTYLKNHSPILTEGAGNVRCLDHSGIIRSQYLESMDVSTAPSLKSPDLLDAH